MSERADFNCPGCNSSDVYQVNGSDRFKCQDCGQVTLESVGLRQDELEELAASDLAASEMAEKLLRGDGDE